MAVPITPGSGASSVAAELVGGLNYQQIEVYGGGGSSVLSINPDGSLKASIIGIPNVVIVGGSIASAGVANQSVSGIVGASIIGLPNVNVGGSVVAFQGGNTVTSLVSTIPSSVLVGASIFGQLPAGTAAIGSIATLQGTNPWIIVGSVYGSGSVVAFQAGTWNNSIVSTVPSSVLVGASIFGQLPGGTATLGSIATVQGTNPWVIVGSVYGSGSVVSFQGGTQIHSIVSSTPSSVLVGASIFGQLPAGTAMIGSIAAYQGSIPWTISSVYGNISGSVVAFISGTPTVNTAGSVISFEGGTWINSVISSTPSSLLTGGYAQRNDNVSSFLGGNLTWNPVSTDSAGRMITKPFTSDDGTTIRFQTSTVSTSVILAQASAIGKRNYVTDMWFSNTGAATTLVTIKDGSTSILGYTIVPTTGGSNSPGIHVPLRSAVSQDLTVVNATATSTLYITINGYQAP